MICGFKANIIVFEILFDVVMKTNKRNWKAQLILKERVLTDTKIKITMCPHLHHPKNSDTHVVYFLIILGSNVIREGFCLSRGFTSFEG